MYIIGNALKNLGRNKGRNILISTIMLAIISATVVTLSVARTADGIIEDYRARFGSRVNISPDYDALYKANGQASIVGGTSVLQVPTVTEQQALLFAQSTYIAEYTISGQHAGNDPNIVAVGAGETPMLFDAGEQNMPYFQLMGNMWDEFETGERFLNEGAMPVTIGEVLVSMDLAELNELSVGSTLRFYSTIPVNGEATIISRNLIVSGIYMDLTEASAYGSFITIPFGNRRNEILTNLETLTADLDEYGVSLPVTAVFYLRDPSYLPAFEAEMRADGLDDMLIVSTDEASFNAIVEPVVGLRSVVQTFMWVTLILGGIVLLIVSFIAIRERKYEIGVLRAMGMKKHKLALGLWVEMLAITVICLAFGVFIGSVVSQPISDVLLAAQVESLTQAQDSSSNVGGMMGVMMLNTEETHAPLTTLDISLGIETIMQIAGISLLLATLATVVSIIRIAKYEPIKILQERN